MTALKTSVNAYVCPIHMKQLRGWKCESEVVVQVGSRKKKVVEEGEKRAGVRTMARLQRWLTNGGE